MKQELVAEILRMPVAERMRLVEVIADSIAAAPEEPPLTERQKDELERRLAQFEAEPDSGEALAAVFARFAGVDEV
jgi:putative addiction module component (TIGR02574 family)